MLSFGMMATILMGGRARLIRRTFTARQDSASYDSPCYGGCGTIYELTVSGTTYEWKYVWPSMLRTAVIRLTL